MKNQTESLEHASVRQYCKAVRMPTIGANFLSLAEQAVKENHSHIRYLEALLAIECEERDRHAISNRIRDAQLPRMKTPATTVPVSVKRQLSGPTRPEQSRFRQVCRSDRPELKRE